MVLVATQVKRRRGTTAENDAFTGAEGEITVDTEKHELRVHDGVTQGGFKIGGGSGSGRNTGDTFMTKRTDTNLAGAVECDGATYNTTDFTGTGSIGELLEAGKLGYISLSAYSTAISTKGWCDEIGWDGTGTTAFRVPTLNAHIVQTNNIPVIGNGRILKLGNSPSTATSNVFTGAQSGGSFPLSVATGFSTNQEVYYPTDSARSSMVADTTDTAQLRVMIQIANGATDEAVATVGGVLADVAGLKDLSNITADGKEVCANLAMPSGRYTDLTLGASDSTYTAPADGYFIIQLKVNALANHWVNLDYVVNGTNVFIGNWWGKVANNTFGIPMIPIKKGMGLRITYGSDITGANVFKFMYAEGAQ